MKTSIAYQIIKESSILNRSVSDIRSPILKKISDRIIERKLRVDQIVKIYRDIHREKFLENVRLENGTCASWIFKILPICPKFKDRYDIFMKDN